MGYSLNPCLPKVRAQAVKMVLEGKGIRLVARYFGVYPSTVSRWVKKSPLGGCSAIPTLSSKPRSHPKRLDEDIVERIVDIRLAHGRCAEIVHRELLNSGVVVSLSSVKRVLARRGMIKKRSPWKRKPCWLVRPSVSAPGDLVEVDTIHEMYGEKKRLYVYTLLDLHSRWAHAWASMRANTHMSIKFVRSAQERFPFRFNCLQSDHGSKFSRFFAQRVGFVHRHSRVRKPNDNAHLERFNRTLQDEFLRDVPSDVGKINEGLPAYLEYYNTRRLHLGIEFKTPSQILKECCKAID